MRRTLIAGNWKMNGLTGDGVALATSLADRARSAGSVPFDMLLCPPATLLSLVADATGDAPLAIGGQDCHTADSGAHTGDISAAMLKDLGCSYVIVGHSERRADHDEPDSLIKAKAEAAIRHGLTAIVCIGETEAEREAGKTLDVVGGQFKGSLPEGATPYNTVIAYEPVWAIGSGKTATPDDAAEVHAAIRKDAAVLKDAAFADGLRILYGGSVKPGNAADLLSLPDVDGALVGGASLKAEDFWAIAQATPGA